MQVDFGRLAINQVIVHAIPRKAKYDDNPPPLRLSEVVSPLEEAVRTQLQSRLRGDLNAAAQEVVEDPEHATQVPRVIQSYLEASDADLVSVSRQLAIALRESQNGSNPDGMLLVAECTLEDSRTIMIVKLEHQDGVQASFLESDGKKTFDVQQVKDLMYTSKSRVYKIGIFSRAQMGTGDGISGHVADKQSSAGNAAQFFLRYLGCRTRQDPSETTRQFYERATDWINSAVPHFETKTNYTVALHAELRSQSVDVSPREFARKHLGVDDRDSFLNHVCSEEVPRGGFTKDTERVEKMLSNLQFKFASGASAVIPRTAFDDGIASVEQTDTGRSRLVIEDEVAPQVKGKGERGKSTKPVDSEQASLGITSDLPE
ncbi:nucleoid-associated protein [Streptomyces sp. NPDC101169]|uniref:nucleoid-associated protein n=1 Tax=Streptomyces sp. NPDC101169 TaxID=3366121 RepID=UPI00380A7C4E